MRKQKSSRYLYKMDELRASRGNHCAIDASGKTCSPCLDFAHLVPSASSTIPRSRGKADRYHEIKRNPHLFALICKRHHRALDRALWQWIDGMRERVMEAMQQQPEEVPF